MTGQAQAKEHRRFGRTWTVGEDCPETREQQVRSRSILIYLSANVNLSLRKFVIRGRRWPVRMLGEVKYNSAMDVVIKLFNIVGIRFYNFAAA